MNRRSKKRTWSSWPGRLLRPQVKVTFGSAAACSAGEIHVPSGDLPSAEAVAGNPILIFRAGAAFKVRRQWQHRTIVSHPIYLLITIAFCFGCRPPFSRCWPLPGENSKVIFPLPPPPPCKTPGGLDCIFLGWLQRLPARDSVCLLTINSVQGSTMTCTAKKACMLNLGQAWMSNMCRIYWLDQ